jgi:hypothetical protein
VVQGNRLPARSSILGRTAITDTRIVTTNCGSDRTDFVVTSRDNPPQPW